MSFSHDERGKNWLEKMVTYCALKEEKTFQLFLRNDSASIFASKSPRPTTAPLGASITADNAKRLIQSVFELCFCFEPGMHFTDRHFWQTDIRNGVVGPFGLHVGIISNGPDRWILTVTATLTNEEVERVKAACEEAHYNNVDELLDEARRIGEL